MAKGSYIGHKEDAAVTDHTADATVIAALKGLLSRMAAQLGAALGQATMAASMPVVIASDQSDVPVAEAPVACAAADVHAPAANTAAVVTYAGSAGVKHVITGIAWSYYGGIPTNGNLIIEDVSGTTVFNVDIHEEGPGAYYFHKPKKGAAVNTAMIITLAAGGAGITGKVSILSHWTES